MLSGKRLRRRGRVERRRIPCCHRGLVAPLRCRSLQHGNGRCYPAGWCGRRLARPRVRPHARHRRLHAAARWSAGWRASSPSIPTPISPMLSTTSRSPARCGRATGCSTAWAAASRISSILGGWYGVLAAMLLEDPRFAIGSVESIDIDPAVAAVAETLNRDAGDRFRATTADMYAIDYARLGADLIVNTSCEHIADLRGMARSAAEGRQRAAAVERLFQRADPHQLRRIGRGLRAAGRARRAPLLRHAADEEIQSLHADRVRFRTRFCQQARAADSRRFPRAVEIEPMRAGLRVGELPLDRSHEA